MQYLKASKWPYFSSAVLFSILAAFNMYLTLLLPLIVFILVLHFRGLLIHPKVIFLVYLANILVILITFRNRGVASSGIDAQLLVKMCFWIFSFFILVVNSYRLKYGRPGYAELLLALYVVCMWFSVLYSPNMFYSFSAVFVFFMLFFYTRLVFSFYSKKFVVYSINNLLFFFSVASLILYLIMPAMAVQEFWGDDGLISGVRYKGMSSNGNEIGQVSAILIILTVYLRRTGVLTRNTMLAYVSVGFISLVLSWSRMSLLGCFLSVVYLLLANKPKVLAGITIAVSLMCFFIYLFFDLFVSYLPLLSRNGGVEELFTFTGRTFIWDAVWALIKESPFMGYGYASSKTLIPLNFEMPWGWTTVNSHSFVLQMLLSTGFVGSLPIFLVLIYQIRQSFLCTNILPSSIFIFVIITGLLESGAYGPIPNFMTIIWIFSLYVYGEN